VSITNLFTANVNSLVILAHGQLKENVCCHQWQYKYFHDPLEFVGGNYPKVSHCWNLKGST
jgi:hypothetical protein